MLEFTSVKVSSYEHADMAIKLTTMSAEGWQVVNIMSTSLDIVAFLSRTTQDESVGSPSITSTVGPTPTPVATSSNGWASTSSATDSETSNQTSAPTVPAAWYKDPAGRFEFRYWNGTVWTDNTSRGGVIFKDPPTR